MAIKLHYSGKWLHWMGEGGDSAKFHASSGLVGTDKKGEDLVRMFRVGPIVHVLVLDWRCTWYEKMRDHGPIPTGTYQVATQVKGYANYNATNCNLLNSFKQFRAAARRRMLQEQPRPVPASSTGRTGVTIASVWRPIGTWWPRTAVAFTYTIPRRVSRTVASKWSKNFSPRSCCRP